MSYFHRFLPSIFKERGKLEKSNPHSSQNGKAPKLSTTTDPDLSVAQPADAPGCKDAPPAAAKAKGKKAKGKKAKDEKAREEAEETQKVEIPYLSGTSRR
ncbi:MAG: hypothetical protein H0X49_03595 [Acidobacteria bacterium]|nr:hypothetical protein [Acidobacteriota bacterium]